MLQPFDEPFLPDPDGTSSEQIISHVTLQVVSPPASRRWFSTKGASISSHRQTKETLIEVWRSVIDLVFQHEVACDRHVWHQQLDSQRAHSGRARSSRSSCCFQNVLVLAQDGIYANVFFSLRVLFQSTRPFGPSCESDSDLPHGHS